MQDGGNALVTVMSDVHRESPIDQLLGDQRRGLAIAFDAQNRLACLQHGSLIPNGGPPQRAASGNAKLAASQAKNRPSTRSGPSTTNRWPADANKNAIYGYTGRRGWYPESLVRETCFEALLMDFGFGPGEGLGIFVIGLDEGFDELHELFDRGE